MIYAISIVIFLVIVAGLLGLISIRMNARRRAQHITANRSSGAKLGWAKRKAAKGGAQ